MCKQTIASYLQNQIYVCILIIMLGAGSSFAIIRVPEQYELIQSAIEAADNGDTILIAPGEYTGAVDFQGKRITISSLFLINSMREYIDSTVILGDGDEPVISFVSDEDRLSRLCGVTISGGRSGFGGGIYCGEGSSPTIDYCKITGNHASGLGGGVIAWQESDPLLQYCEIYGNTANTGAGLVIRGDSQPILINCVISGNRATNDAGGIFCLSGGMPVIINSIIWNNFPEEILFKDTGLENGIILAFCLLRDGADGVILEDNGDADIIGRLIADDPVFTDPEQDRFNLEWNSPCLDAGTITFVLDGDTLIQLGENDYLGESVEIGAHEIDPDYTPEREMDTVRDYNLMSLYPNPVNGSITINIDLEAQGQIKINLYDQSGRLVKALENSAVSAGKHVIGYNLDYVSAGSYIIELQTNGSSEAINLIILK